MASLSFEPLDTFDAQAEKDFSKVGNTDFYRHEHQAGLCALFAAMKGGKRVGTIMFCSETKEATGEKIFAVVAASSTTKTSLIAEGKDLIDALARRTGHSQVKFYTRRAQLARKFVEMGANAKISWSV